MKKGLFVFSFLCGVLAALSARPQKDANAPAGEYILTIGLPVEGGLCEAPFYIAIEKGFYDEEGLEWEEFKMDPGTAMNHLTNGTIDVTNNLLATLIQPIANGLDIKIPLGVCGALP